MSSETSDAMLSFFVSVAAALTEGLGVAEATAAVERRRCCCFCFEYSILIQNHEISK